MIPQVVPDGLAGAWKGVGSADTGWPAVPALRCPAPGD